MKNKYEVLSPCGSMEALRAAVQNGADAVYLGGTEFSARASAANFDRRELEEAIKYAKLRGTEVFVTVNTSIKEDEIDSLVEYTDFLYSIGIDALIISDIGAARILRKRYPYMELHASTQISAHSLKDALELKKAGFDRVVVARELNVDEIKEICEKSGVDIEVFVHGALCVSYSGQCLMSSMLGTRSGNRGRCAQPCRQTYRLKNTVTGEVYDDVDANYLLSPKDLCSIDNVDEILSTNLKSLKIEGRMKRPEYVATVTEKYRKAVDRYLGIESGFDRREAREQLEAIFNRGFTDGYLMKKCGSDVMNPQKPHNVGAKIGTVISFNKKSRKLKIKLSGNLSKGDGINLGGGDIGRIIKNGKVFEEGRAGETVEIDFIKNVKSGTPVYKTSDRKLIEKAGKTVKEGVENKKIKLNASVYISVGEKIKMSLDDGSVSVEYESDECIEAAKNKKLSSDMVKEKLSKTGNTPYEFEFSSLDIDENAFVPVSLLNSVRREAIDLYEHSKLDFSIRKINAEDIEKVEIKDGMSKGFIYFAENSDSNSGKNILKAKKSDLGKLALKVHKNSQLDDIIKHRSGFEYIKEIFTEDVSSFENYRSMLSNEGINLVYSAPGVLRNEEYDRLDSFLKKSFDRADKVMISTWGEKEFFEERFKTASFCLDTYFNVYNSSSVKYFIENFPVDSITVSQEINRGEIEDMIDALEADGTGECVNLDMIVYTNPRSMLTEYCPMGVVTKDCHKNKRDASCSRCDYVLEDKEGREFRLFQDIFCRTEIRGDRAIDIRNYIGEIFDMGIDRVRLDFTSHSPSQAMKVVEGAVKALEGNEIQPESGSYEGHYFTSVD